MSWQPFNPGGTKTGESNQFPRIFWARHTEWLPLIQEVDSNSSHPDVWDFLAQLVTSLKAKTIVEAGTYRGHATFAMAEALKLAEQEGHVWTCDVEDFQCDEVLEQLGLSDRVTKYVGRFEAMLETVPDPIDLAFVDASDPNIWDLRLQYVALLSSCLSPNGVIVVDDATDDAWPGAAKLRETCGLYLPVGRGLALYQRKQ